MAGLMRVPARFVLALAALLLTGAGLAPAPAAGASGYCTGAGVNVAVDFGVLGGGIQKGCATGAGSRSAASAFAAAGVSLTRVSQFPGAICRVEGRPSTSCTTMPPADAYWALFSSHGGGWSFSSRGVDSLRASSGDTVAFAWQTGSRRPPGTAPAVAAPAPAPSKKPVPSTKPAPSTAGAKSSTRPTPTTAGTTGASAPAGSTPTASASARTPRAATSLLARAVPTHGSACADGGVTVVADFHQLPGGIVLGCATGAVGGSAWDALEAGGLRLTELTKFAGGICRVDGRPANAACTSMPPADAYWSLYVPKGAGWTYATKGAKQLVVADGDVVALSWQQGTKPAPPRLTPAEVAAATAAPSPGATASPSPDATAGSAADPGSDPADGDSDGLPWWVPVLVVVVLAAGGGAAVLVRRRAASRPGTGA